MQEMSDDEADNIVVAMAGRHGPLGDAFEVDAAAAQAASRPPAPAAATRAPTAASNDSNAAPAPADDAAGAAMPPANNTRLVRVKAQLCRLWRIEPAALDAAFESRSRDFFAKLCRLAQMQSVDFETAQRELQRARHTRINGTSIELPLRGVSRDRHWAPSDVDRAIDAIGSAGGRDAVLTAGGGRKRTATQATAKTSAKRQRSSTHGANGTHEGTSTAHAEHSRGIPIDPSLEDGAGYESDRASVPRAASIAREQERQQERDAAPQPQPQPQPRPMQDQTIHVQRPTQQEPSRPQSASPLAARESSTARERTGTSSPDGIEEGASAPTVQDMFNSNPLDRSEALRCLESSKTLPHHLFNQVLQEFCCANASQVAYAPITAASGRLPPDLPYFLNSYNSIILPFHLDNRWTLATVELKHKEAKLYGPAAALNRTQTAVEDFLATSLNTKDMRVTRVPIASPPNSQDEPITCLVTAIHIIADTVPQPSEPDPILWRRVLAAFLRGTSSAAAQLPSPAATAASPPTAAPIPPTTTPLSIAALFAHLETHLAATRARHETQAARLGARAQSHGAAHALLDALAGAPRVEAELAAYAVRAAQLPGTIENVESTIASLRRLGIESTVRELEACVRGLREVRRRDGARVARLEVLAAGKEGIRDGLVAGEERDREEMGELEKGFGEVWREVEGAWEGLKGRFGG